MSAARTGAGAVSGSVTLSLMPGALMEVTVWHEAGRTPRWTAAARIDDAASFWTDLVRGALAGSLGALEDLEVRSGSVRVELGGVLERGRPVEGEVDLHGLAVTTGSGALSVGGLDLELPVQLVGSSAGGRAPTCRQGTLAFTSLAAAGVSLPTTSTGLEVCADSVALVQPLIIPVLGGEVELDGLTGAGLLGSGRRLEASVGLRGVSLERLTLALGLPLLAGELSGGFPRVRLDPSTLRVDGRGELELFGGRLEVFDISGRDVLSRYSRLRFSADWQDIDLAQVTSTFDFGEMSGVVAGFVRDCELYRGVPLSCSAELRSVETEGVPRRVSLKAVNNIAILGTGSGLGVLDRGIHRLIDSYRYQALGVRMELGNDRFLLRGLEERGGAELFLAGRLPLRLDVVNVQPGTTVSFSTMLERLSSLDLEAVRTHP